MGVVSGKHEGNGIPSLQPLRRSNVTATSFRHTSQNLAAIFLRIPLPLRARDSHHLKVAMPH